MPSLSPTSDLMGLGLGVGAAIAILAEPSASGPLLLIATGALFAWVVWRDASEFTIPDGAVVALAAVGIAARFADQRFPADVIVSLAGDVALTGGALWILRELYFRWRGHDGLGLGDVKLAAAAGCLVGADGFSFALLAAAVAGLVLAAARGARLSDKIAFGVLLAPAIWIALAAEVALARGGA